MNFHLSLMLILHFHERMYLTQWRLMLLFQGRLKDYQFQWNLAHSWNSCGTEHYTVQRHITIAWMLFQIVLHAQRKVNKSKALVVIESHNGFIFHCHVYSIHLSAIFMTYMQLIYRNIASQNPAVLVPIVRDGITKSFIHTPAVDNHSKLV